MLSTFAYASSPAITHRPKPQKTDRLSTQPAELTLRIFGFLGPKELATIAAASSYMFTLATQDFLWKKQCESRWATKLHTELKLHPRVNYSHLLPQMSNSEIIDVLCRRQPGFPKLRSSLETCTREELEMKLEETTPKGEYVFTPNISGKWKSSYIAAELDAGRQVITKEELVGYEWQYTDSWGFGFYHEGEEKLIKVRFFPNGFRANVDPKASRPRKQPWHIDKRGAVQVAQFPPHSTPARLPNWGWEFANGYVTYTSC
ncbi:hypothetical protein HDV05_008110 [Chytridiales sp. JEL 0842]|nr:hypothetical protein HDV05_008110 [Chytridiales sp. JEL 0842]